MERPCRSLDGLEASSFASITAWKVLLIDGALLDGASVGDDTMRFARFESMFALESRLCRGETEHSLLKSLESMLLLRAVEVKIAPIGT